MGPWLAAVKFGAFTDWLPLRPLFAVMAVEGAVSVLQLYRSIMTKVCDPGLSCHADPGVEIPS